MIPLVAIGLLGLLVGYIVGAWHANASLNKLLTNAGAGLKTESLQLVTEIKAAIAKHEGKGTAAPAGTVATATGSAATTAGSSQS